MHYAEVDIADFVCRERKLTIDNGSHGCPLATSI